MSDEKPDLFWTSDSGGTLSCCINGPDLSFKDSLIGTLMLKNNEWHPILKTGEDLGAFPSMDRARKGMESFYRKTIAGIKGKK